MSDISLSLCELYNIKKNKRLQNAIDGIYPPRDSLICPNDNKTNSNNLNNSNNVPTSERRHRLLFSNKINCKILDADLQTPGIQNYYIKSTPIRKPPPTIKNIDVGTIFNLQPDYNNYSSLYDNHLSNNNKHNNSDRARLRYNRKTHNTFDKKLRQQDKSLTFIGKSSGGINKNYLLGYTFEDDNLITSSCKVYNVTVGKSSIEKSKFFIDGEQQKFLILLKGTHIFNLKSPSLDGYEFSFSETSDGSHNPIDGLVYKSPNISYQYINKKIIINVTDDFSTNLYYFSRTQKDMGAEIPVTHESKNNLQTKYFNDIDWGKINNNNSVLITHVPKDVNKNLAKNDITKWELDIHDLIGGLRNGLKSSIGGWRTEYFIIKKGFINHESQKLINKLSERFGHEIHHKYFTGSIQHYPHSIIATVIPSNDEIKIIKNNPSTMHVVSNDATIIRRDNNRINNNLRLILNPTNNTLPSSNLLRKLRSDTVHEYFHIHQMRLSGGRIHKNPIITISNEWDMPWLTEGSSSIYTNYFLNDFEISKCEHFDISSAESFWNISNREYTQLNILRNIVDDTRILFTDCSNYSINSQLINDYNTWHNSDISCSTNQDLNKRGYNAYIVYVLYLMQIVFKATGSHREIFFTFWENLKENVDINIKSWEEKFTETFYNDVSNSYIFEEFQKEIKKYNDDSNNIDLYYNSNDFMDKTLFKLVEYYLKNNKSENSFDHDISKNKLIPYNISFTKYNNDLPPWPGAPIFVEKYDHQNNSLDHPPWPGPPYFSIC